MGRTELIDGTVISFPILAIIGIPANLITVVILSRGKCSLSKGITRYMITMAIADLMVCIFNVTLGSIFFYHFRDSFLSYTNVCRLNTFIQVSVIQLSVWSTTLFTFDRFVAICCPKLKLKYCTKRTANIVLMIVSALSFLINIPVYFRYEPYYTVAEVQWGCRTVTGYSSSPAWIAYKWVAILSVPLIPFPTLLLLNSLTVRHILVASRSRRALNNRITGETNNDLELKNRRTSIILLFAISGSCIALWTPIVILHICFDLTETTTLKDPRTFYLTMRITLLLMYSTACTNTCIYVLTQRRFRTEIQKMVKYPFTLLYKLLK